MSELTDQWNRDGFVVVRNLLSAKQVAILRPLCDDILSQWRACDAQFGNPSNGDEMCMRHLNHPAYFRAQPEKLETVMATAADAKVLGVVRELIHGDPLFRTLSYFINPLNTHRDGDWHRDSQFIIPNAEQERRALLDHDPRLSSDASLQMQIALVSSEDTEYVPGSHLRWDTEREYHIRWADGQKHNRSNDMPGAIRVRLEPGDAAVFNPFGLHRGRYHLDKLRRTLMLTYTTIQRPIFDEFIDQPWFLEPDYLPRLSPGTRAFFQPFVDTFKERWLAAQRS